VQHLDTFCTTMPPTLLQAEYEVLDKIQC